MFQASWRKIDALCPNFPKFLISSSHQCCSWMCRWVCCIPASLLQFSEHCQLFLRTSPIPLMSPVTWAGPITAVVGCLQLLLIEGKEFPSMQNLYVESSCHVFVDSTPNRWTRHRMKDAVGEQWCLPKD